MELQYVYTKLRHEFGKQCLFSDRGPELIDNYVPNPKLMREYIHRNPVNQFSQCSAIMAEHEVNTVCATFTNSSMNHTEGGWPKDVNIHDEDQPKRYRRKIEKDESYVLTVLQLCKNMEHCILQNNSVNIYQHYFADLEPAPLVEANTARTVNVYQDQCVIKRPVTHISWSPDDGSKMAITYCNLDFQPTVLNQSPNSYIWEVENPNCPMHVFKPSVPLVCLEYNMKDQNSLVAGMLNGQVSVWDTRRGHDAVEISVIENSHRDPVRSVLWIQSKSGSEFFSGSSDGQCKWWDVRKLSEPLETLIFDLCRPNEEQQISRAQGVSCLEYESTIPTRFMVGTEHGCVISGNRKGKTPWEKLAGKFNAQIGPVYALERNSAFVKNFLTVGDWTARIWSEDTKDSAIIWTNYHRAHLTCGAWSPTRYSVFFLTRDDGVLDLWDVLQLQTGASLSVKVCDEPLNTLRTHEMGRLVAVGNQRGTTYLVEFSENLAIAQKNDKQFLTQMFERETHRERIMEARLREIRLKARTQFSGVGDMETESAEIDQEEINETVCKAAEAEFYKVIENELHPPPPEVPKEVKEPEPEPEPEPVPEPVPEPPKKGKSPKKDKKEKKGKKKKYSVFFLTRNDGVLDLWDVLQLQKGPSLSVKVCDEPLKTLRTHEMGRLVAVGNKRGTTYLVEFSENLAIAQKNDKQFLTQMFERETHREKIMEARLREIRLKARARPSGVPDPENESGDVNQEEINESVCKTAEEEFYKVIENELHPTSPEGENIIPSEPLPDLTASIPVPEEVKEPEIEPETEPKPEPEPNPEPEAESVPEPAKKVKSPKKEKKEKKSRKKK